MKKKMHAKEPSLFRKIIDIHHEQALRRKALRQLSEQSWSVDFLSLLLVKAGKLLGNGVQLSITDKNGITMTLTYNDALKSDAVTVYNDDIFDKLDDDAAIESFIKEHTRR